MTTMVDIPKPPRWISTEAGLWAWHMRDSWRATATSALSVQERHRLLHEAEQLRQAASSAAAVLFH